MRREAIKQVEPYTKPPMHVCNSPLHHPCFHDQTNIFHKLNARFYVKINLVCFSPNYHNLVLGLFPDLFITGTFPVTQGTNTSSGS